ncbi:IS3 family transposase [Caballeronia sp. NK8]|uniref:IS3 family transposase n=1 Tax=Caballeronia sp. NK8 TaxID=140098 RepID=UPI001BCB8F1D
MLARIRTLHASSRGTYGAPRIHPQLEREAVHVGRKRVARLMRIAGLCGAVDGDGHTLHDDVRQLGLRRTSYADTSARGAEDTVSDRCH